MFELQIENANGLSLKLTQNENDYKVISINGLNPPSATVNTIKGANMHGSVFGSSFLNERNIVLTVAISGDVEKNRQRLYEFLGSASFCKIYYSNNSKKVYCEGYIESVECDLFTINQQVQVSILCADPYLYALNLIYVDISKTFDNFEFPFSIEKSGIDFAIINPDRRAEIINVGEPTGIEMRLFVKIEDATVSNPIIYNAKTGEFLKINTDINYGDIVIINTKKGKKSLKKIRDGVETNIINSLEKGSTWHQLASGYNVFDYSSDTGQTLLHIEFNYNVVYKGV